MDSGILYECTMLEKSRKNNYLLCSSVDEPLRSCMHAICSISTIKHRFFYHSPSTTYTMCVFNVLELSTLFYALQILKFSMSTCYMYLSVWPHNDCSGYINDDDDPLFSSLRLPTRPTNITFSHYNKSLLLRLAYIKYLCRMFFMAVLYIWDISLSRSGRRHHIRTLYAMSSSPSLHYCCCAELTQHICDYQLVHISFILVTRSLFYSLTPKTLIKFQNSQTVHGMVEKCSNGNYVLYMSTGNTSVQNTSNTFNDDEVFWSEWASRGS